MTEDKYLMWSRRDAEIDWIIDRVKRTEEEIKQHAEELRAELTGYYNTDNEDSNNICPGILLGETDKISKTHINFIKGEAPVTAEDKGERINGNQRKAV